jgi:sporulation protein YlmC with PRC-barrel domain
MYLVRDILDKEIVDRHGFKGGKVDDLLLEETDDGRLAVRAVITGHDSLARLLGRGADRLASWAGHTVLGLPADLEPIHLDWAKVTAIDVVVHMDIDRDDAGLMVSEQLIWERWVSRLPLARR